MNNSQDFYFIHVPKCAGKSIKSSLGWHPPLKSDHYSLTNILSGWLNNKNQNVPTISVEEFSRKFSFTIVRNPWDRMVSWFYFFRLRSERPPGIESGMIKNNKRYVDFNEWILDGAPFSWANYEIRMPYEKGNDQDWKHQYLFYTDLFDRTKLTKIYKLNELKDNWKEICYNCIGTVAPLWHENMSWTRRKNPVYDKDSNICYKHEYNDESRKKVAKMCEKDIDLMKWTF
jgi:hypothetical protein